MCGKIETMECYECDEVFPCDSMNTNSDDEWICGDCGVQSHCFCEKCDDYIRTSNSKMVDNHDSDEIVVLCDDCFEDYCYKCKECDYAYMIDENSEFDTREHILEDVDLGNGVLETKFVCHRCFEGTIEESEEIIYDTWSNKSIRLDFPLVCYGLSLIHI